MKFTHLKIIMVMNQTLRVPTEVATTIIMMYRQLNLRVLSMGLCRLVNRGVVIPLTKV